MTWLMKTLKIELEEYLPVNNYLIKHLIFLKVQNMMDINVDLLKWFINVLIKKNSGGTVKNEKMSNNELAG